MSRLGDALIYLRGAKNQSKLAEELEMSRGYYSLLESRGETAGEKKKKEPSLEYLRKISRALIGDELNTPKQFRDACRLGLAALDYEFNDPFAGLIGDMDGEIAIQGDLNVKEVWIIADVIAETRHDGILEQTVKNLRRDVRYVYFVPSGAGAQWNTCLERIESGLRKLDGTGPAFLREGNRLRAVACPSMMCVVPIRVLNPASSADVTITLGERLDHLLLFSLGPGQSKKLVDELDGVLNVLKDQPHWTSDHITYELLYGMSGGNFNE